jgi:hypothetical protein
LNIDAQKSRWEACAGIVTGCDSKCGIQILAVARFFARVVAA